MEKSSGNLKKDIIRNILIIIKWVTGLEIILNLKKKKNILMYYKLQRYYIKPYYRQYVIIINIKFINLKKIELINILDY